MIENLTKKIKISENEVYLTNILQKTRGVLFRRKIKEPYVFEFNPPTKENAIHMFFVFYPLTIVWLNKEGVVVKKTLAEPFGVYSHKGFVKTIIEMPKSFFDKIEEGDYISFTKNKH